MPSSSRLCLSGGLWGRRSWTTAGSACGSRNYSASGTFIEYFAGWGGILPGTYWLDWIEHWLVRATGSVPLLRLVPLAAGVAIWIVCRYALAQAIGPEAHRRFVASTMAVTYLVGFGAWGMTLRPEPILALLAAGVLVAILRFVRRPAVGPLAVAGVLAAFSLTAHPAGIVALAPILAVVRELRPGSKKEAPCSGSG